MGRGGGEPLPLWLANFPCLYFGLHLHACSSGKEGGGRGEEKEIRFKGSLAVTAFEKMYRSAKYNCLLSLKKWYQRSEN